MDSKPANATYVGTIRVDATTGITRHVVAPDPHPLQDVEVTWYPEGRVKVTFSGGNPVVITQAFITGKGRDSIIEVRKD